MNTNDQFFEAYVPVYDDVPEKWEEGRQFLVEHLKRISNAVNVRTIGWLLDEELLSGQSFIPGVAQPNPQIFRSVLRKVIDFGPLPNTGLKSVPHGIQFNANFTLIHMWASATDPVNLIAFPIPYAGAGGHDAVALYMDATNINIITETNRSTYTRCFVVMEYIQEL